MNTTMTDRWRTVETYVNEAKLIAWDTCHKIYLAMDDTQADWFRLNYESVVQDDPEVMLEMLHAWYDNSCFLKFIEAVETNEDDPNAGFTTLIPQGADEDDWDEEE